MDLVYPISYLASLSGLVGWFIFQENKRISRKASAMFLIGFLVYLVALTFAAADLPYKLLILFRDLLVLGVVSQLFNIVRRSLILAIFLAGAAALTVYFSYFNILVATFPQLNVKTLDADGEFLVKVTDDGRDDIYSLEKHCQCAVSEAFSPQSADLTELDNYFVLDVQSDKPAKIKRVKSMISRMDFITWVEPNEVITLDLPEEVTRIKGTSKHYVDDPDIAYQWGFEPMGMNDLHRALLKSGVQPQKVARIAIVDSGVDGSHEDLSANYQSYKKAYDSDSHGHGTHCAGIAGAVSNNGIGIASTAPGTGYVSITGFRAINAMGMGTQKSVIKAIIEATDDGVDVISMSLGGPTQRKKEKAYTEAVKYANDHNVIVVVAAGNNGKSAKTITPANIDGVITVAATDKQNNRAYFSNTVDNIKMGIAAPGINIYSTVPGNNYKAFNGTSMATPQVAGLIGLMRSFYPELSTEEAYTILNNTGKKTKAGGKTGRLIQPNSAIQEILD